MWAVICLLLISLVKMRLYCPFSSLTTLANLRYLLYVVPAHCALSKFFLCIFTLKLYISMLLRWVWSSNYPKFAKVCRFLFVPNISTAFLKHARAMPVSENYFNIWYQQSGIIKMCAVSVLPYNAYNRRHHID